MAFKGLPITIKDDQDLTPLNIQRLMETLETQVKELFEENIQLRARVKALEDAE